MFDTLLGKIAGLFEKDFLFASFLPALIFIIVLVATVAGVVSIEATWAWVDSWTAMQKAAAAMGATLFIVVVAYILQALRTSFTRGWTGNSRSKWLWGPQKLGVQIQKRGYRRLLKASWKISPWQDVLEDFRKDSLEFWSRDLKPAANGRMRLPANISLALLQRVESLRIGMTEAEVKEQLKEFIEAYKTYSGDDLRDIYKAIKVKLTEWHDNEETRIQTDSYNLDRRFGKLQTIRATGLGNVIEAYNYYAFKRYKIEPDIFWQRLRKVIPPEYLALVQESRILLDFLLTMATLAALYALLALSVGPWLWFSLWLWLLVSLLAMIISYFFYGLSVGAAHELGEMVRSSFDLFRLDLMAALQRPRPATLSAEQAQWEELGTLAVYGFKTNFDLRPEKVPEAATTAASSESGEPK